MLSKTVHPNWSNSIKDDFYKPKSIYWSLQVHSFLRTETRPWTWDGLGPNYSQCNWVGLGLWSDHHNHCRRKRRTEVQADHILIHARRVQLHFPQVCFVSKTEFICHGGATVWRLVWLWRALCSGNRHILLRTFEQIQPLLVQALLFKLLFLASISLLWSHHVQFPWLCTASYSFTRSIPWQKNNWIWRGLYCHKHKPGLQKWDPENQILL